MSNTACRTRSEDQPERPGNLPPQLVDQHPATHRLNAAGLQVEQLERPERDADQAVHREPQVVEDGAHLPVLALAQADCEPDVAALRLVECGLDGAVAQPTDLHAALEPVERLLCDSTVRPHPVAPQPTGGRQFQMARQGAVVGEQEEPLGVHVEPANRDHARQVLRQRVEHGGAPLRVLVGGDEPLGLVVAP
jgi:hypothetical protein